MLFNYKISQGTYIVNMTKLPSMYEQRTRRNVQSGLQDKLEKLQNELSQINLDILVITEHGLTEDDLKLSYVQGFRLDEKYLEWSNGGVTLLAVRMCCLSIRR